MAERVEPEVRMVPVDAAMVEELREHDENDLPVYAPCLDEDDPPEDGDGPCAKCAAYLPLRQAIRTLIRGYMEA